MTDAPGAWLRRAGRGRSTDGATVTWSLAEGARGRRWRWTTVVPDGGLARVGLLELDGAGRFVRLELETPAGMLTLHPDADRSEAHGNVVRADGVEHLRVAWSDDGALGFAEDAFGSSVAGWRGRGWVVRADLGLQAPAHVSAATVLEVDARGVPRLDDAQEWPLEA